jgi:folate-binding protein YgfZ
METRQLEEEVTALEHGRGFVDAYPLRTIAVAGGDAGAWLNDLVTASVEGLSPGRVVRSLLLTPTGRVRADVHVALTDQGYLLFQEPDQPRSIDELLEPYVLSCDVALERVDGPDGPVLVPSGRGWTVALSRPEGGIPVRREAAETWRIRSGFPRFPDDVDQDSLPAEAGLESLIDFAKGCFLGQEAVAKVRNLGHPGRLVVFRRSMEPVGRGEAVLLGHTPVGVVTSTAPLPGHPGSALLARVRWDGRDASLSTAHGVDLAAW